MIRSNEGIALAQKFYVVWAGRQTGVFTDWPTTHQQVDRFAGARYKSFATRAEAERAFAGGAPRSTFVRRAANKTSERASVQALHLHSIYRSTATAPAIPILAGRVPGSRFIAMAS